MIVCFLVPIERGEWFIFLVNDREGGGGGGCVDTTITVFYVTIDFYNWSLKKIVSFLKTFRGINFRQFVQKIAKINYFRVKKVKKSLLAEQ